LSRDLLRISADRSITWRRTEFWRGTAAVTGVAHVSDEPRQGSDRVGFLHGVPTATFRVLFVLVVLSHRRRRLVYFNVAEHPTAEWTARQLLEAGALEEGPRYLIRDRD
jgi:hypothetical protein